MAQATTKRQLALGLPHGEGTPPVGDHATPRIEDHVAPRVESRMELREETVRRVEYSAFPRVGSDTATRIGFTRNISPSGMAIGVDDPLPVGTLLRVLVQRADGHPDFDAVARVAWCRESRDEALPRRAEPSHTAPAEGTRGAPHAWLGLVLVAEVRRGLARVPHATAMPVRRSA